MKVLPFSLQGEQGVVNFVLELCKYGELVIKISETDTTLNTGHNKRLASVQISGMYTSVMLCMIAIY